MSGKRLLAAAEAVYQAGRQLESMIDCLEKLTHESLSNHGFISQIDGSKIRHDDLQGDGDWIVKSYTMSIPLYKSRGKKPYAWIGFMITLYDEEEIAQIEDWEPALYVMYGPGDKDGYWESGAFDYKNDCQLQEPDGRIWLYTKDNKWDSWFFVLPLTKLVNEDALKRFVVEPLCELIKMDVDRLDPTQAFGDNPVLRFCSEGEKVKIIRL